MIDNLCLLDDLIERDLIRVKKSNIFKESPQNLPDWVVVSKIDGMLLGLAVGDSLGATSEGMTSKERYKKCGGEVRDYYPGKRSDFKRIGVPTDDTQLAFRTLDRLTQDKGLVPDNLARRFCEHRIFGIGGTTKTFIKKYKDQGIPWQQSGVDSLGNGALMRIAPIVIPYIRHPSPSMYTDAAIDAMITHNSYANTATCVAYVHMLWALLSMSEPPEPEPVGPENRGRQTP